MAERTPALPSDPRSPNLRLRSTGSLLHGRWYLRLLALVLLAILTVACNTSDEGAAEEEPTTGATVAAETPDPTEVAAPTPEPVGPVVERFVTGQGTSLLDFEGNALVLHGWQPWPEVFAGVDPFSAPAHHLFGPVGERPSDDMALVAIDIEVCASGEQPPDVELFSPRLHLVDDNDDSRFDVDGDPAAALVPVAVIQPAFRWPSAGTCARGWQVLRWSGSPDEAAALNYVAVSRDPETFGERYVYQWTLDTLVDADQVSLRDNFPPDLKVAFPSGPLGGWGVTVRGWRMVGDTADLPVPSVSFDRPFLQPDDGWDLVAALVEVCGGPEGHFPEFGLQVDDWNLLPRFTGGEPWGPGYVTIRSPLPGDCTTGWIPFEIPAGTEPSGVFATDTDDADAIVLAWSVDDEQLPAPATGAAWPTTFLVDTAIEACAASDPVQVDTGAETLELQITSSVAVQEAGNRVVVYLSQVELYPTDVPEPRDEAGSVLQLALNDFAEGGFNTGEFEDDPGSLARVTARILGPEGVPDQDLPGLTVNVTELTPDWVCGEITGGDQASVLGVFAAPLWEP